jgi:hypothetical protein
LQEIGRKRRELGEIKIFETFDRLNMILFIIDCDGGDDGVMVVMMMV